LRGLSSSDWSRDSADRRRAERQGSWELRPRGRHSPRAQGVAKNLQRLTLLLFVNVQLPRVQQLDQVALAPGQLISGQARAVGAEVPSGGTSLYWRGVTVVFLLLGLMKIDDSVRGRSGAKNHVRRVCDAPLIKEAGHRPEITSRFPFGAGLSRRSGIGAPP
jgi:hypothetical protein